MYWSCSAEILPYWIAHTDNCQDHECCVCAYLEVYQDMFYINRKCYFPEKIYQILSLIFPSGNWEKQQDSHEFFVGLVKLINAQTRYNSKENTNNSDLNLPQLIPILSKEKDYQCAVCLGHEEDDRYDPLLCFPLYLQYPSSNLKELIKMNLKDPHECIRFCTRYVKC